jgi:uncharacterized protein
MWGKLLRGKTRLNTGSSSQEEVSRHDTVAHHTGSTGMTQTPLRVHLRRLPEQYAVCRMEPARTLSVPAGSGGFFCITRTSEELSVVCIEELAPGDATVESGWSGLVVAGPLDFSLTGILSAIAEPLAAAGIPIFAVSTYDTDYVFVKTDRSTDAVAALTSAGHTVDGDQ